MAVLPPASTFSPATAVANQRPAWNWRNESPRAGAGARRVSRRAPATVRTNPSGPEPTTCTSAAPGRGSLVRVDLRRDPTLLGRRGILWQPLPAGGLPG